MIFTRVRGFAHRIPRVTTIPNLSATFARFASEFRPFLSAGATTPSIVVRSGHRAREHASPFAPVPGWRSRARAGRARGFRRQLARPVALLDRDRRISTASRNSIASSTRVSPLLPRGEVRRCVLDRATVPRLANRRADQLRATLGHASSVSRETFARRASRDAASSARPRAFFRARRDSTGRTVVSSPSPRATEPRADARSTLVPQATPPTSPPPPARTAAPSPRR